MTAAPPTDTIGADAPPLARAALDLYGAAGATLLDALITALARTCRVEVEGGATLDALDGYVLCYWHGDALGGFVFLFRRRVRLAALCHPAWWLKPWEALGHRRGWRPVLGSSGHGGRRAAERLVGLLREGWSTFVCPDGPAGPPRVARPGALAMAAAAGVPAVPLRFEYGRALALPRWDRMKLPLPFSTVRVRVGEPIRPGASSLDDAARALAEALG